MVKFQVPNFTLIFVFAFLFFLKASVAFPANEAAQRVAEKIYAAGNQYLATEELSKAAEAFEVAALLERYQERCLALLGKGAPKVPGTFPIKAKISEVKKFLERGERGQAILALSEIVDKNPDNERAKTFLSQLQVQEKTKQESEGFSEVIQERFEKAKRLLEEGKREKNYSKLTSAIALFKTEDLKPPFYGQLMAEHQKLAKALREEIFPKLRPWEQAIASPSADLKRIGLQLKEVQKKYPPMTEVEKLLEKIYSLLEERAKPFFIQARTIQELEGCKKAVDKFAKVKEIASFPEVSVWSEVERNLEACGGRENRERKTEN